MSGGSAVVWVPSLSNVVQGFEDCRICCELSFSTRIMCKACVWWWLLVEAGLSCSWDFARAASLCRSLKYACLSSVASHDPLYRSSARHLGQSSSCSSLESKFPPPQPQAAECDPLANDIWLCTGLVDDRTRWCGTIRRSDKAMAISPQGTLHRIIGICEVPRPE